MTTARASSGIRAISKSQWIIIALAVLGLGVSDPPKQHWRCFLWTQIWKFHGECQMYSIFPGDSYITFHRALQNVFEKARSLEFRHSSSGEKSLSRYAAPLSKPHNLIRASRRPKMLHPWC